MSCCSRHDLIAECGVLLGRMSVVSAETCVLVCSSMLGFAALLVGLPPVSVPESWCLRGAGDGSSSWRCRSCGRLQCA